jgi:hypothetical protein
MPRFGGSKRGTDCFIVAHFTHKNNIGRLPQSRSQCGYIPLCVNPHLTLTDYAFGIAVEILDWLFKRDYMPVAGIVDTVDYTSKRGGLTAPRRARNKD